MINKTKIDPSRDLALASQILFFVISILATLIVLIIGWLSISYRTLKAAGTNPAEALRAV